MKIMTCAWCSTPFIQGDTPRKARHCSRACQVQGANDKQRFRDALCDDDDALGYYKYLLRKIVSSEKPLWKSLAGPQWDHMIEVHDALHLHNTQISMMVQGVDMEIGKVLAMPALQPVPKAMKTELKLYCKNRYPKKLPSRK